MGRDWPLVGCLCLSRVSRARSPPAELMFTAGYSGVAASVKSLGGDQLKGNFAVSRRIMVVVDSSPEARSALLWVLSHTVQSHDTLVLLHVTKPSKLGEYYQRRISPKGNELLCRMKNICQTKRPEVQVEVAMVESMDKRLAIVEAVRVQGIALLVLGHRKPSIMWRLLAAMVGRRAAGGRTVEYCIHNADCTTIAVRRKRVGGFLITTRRHRDFWLLA